MNTLVIFMTLLLAIVIFFILYSLQYKKLTELKNIEEFECAPNPDDRFYIELDNEAQACFNYVDKLYTSNLVGNEFSLFKFDGTRSYTYIRDFLDNFFNVSLVVIFRDTSLSTPQTLLHTKYLLIQLIGTELRVTYDPDGDTPQNEIFGNIVQGQRYQLRVIQDFNYKEVYVIFDRYEEFDETQMNRHIFETSPIHSCEYSSGNDFYIACDRNRENYLNAYIGDITFEFDKGEFDRYDITNTTLPVNLECDPTYRETLPVLIPPEPSTSAVAPFENLTNYITIDIGNQFNDLKVKYFDTNIEDHLLNVNTSSISQIINYFNSLRLKETIFSNNQSIIMERNNGFFDGYDNLRDYDNENIYYLFNLNSEKNINILSKLVFLDLLFIKEKYELYNECFIFIYGDRAYDQSYFKFIRVKAPIFIVVYKNTTDKFYQFEQIKVNLRSFYNLQKNYILYLTGRPDSENSVENYLNFVDRLATIEEFTLDHVRDNRTQQLTYSHNFFRLYDPRIDFSSITISIFENNVLQDIVYSKYKQIVSDETCNFVPRGETKFECIQECSDGDYISCKESDCKQLCNNCQNSECKWNIVDIERQKVFVPSSISAKGFSGDGKIKLTWIKPISNYKIEGYFVIVENQVNQNRFDMYLYDGEEEMVEFVIDGLENSLPYSFYIFSKNSQGVSDTSNRVTLIPQKNKLLDMENVSKNTFSDSLQNYYKTLDNSSVRDAEKQIRNMDYIIETNRLKDILVDKIVTSKLKNVNINVY